MSRLIVLVLMVSLGSTSVAFAGEALLSVATRVTREAARNQAPLAPKPAAPTGVQKNWAIAFAQEGPAVSSSGMRKRTKVLIYLASALGVVGSWYAIDHRVEDNTPSTLGTRAD